MPAAFAEWLLTAKAAIQPKKLARKPRAIVADVTKFQVAN
jgi:hypothetical protein